MTRRCSQRQYLLRPSPTVNEVFLFLLAVAARRYDVEIHAFCVMSNHVHIVLTDARARLPAFQQFLGALVARAINASVGHWETFWAPDSYSAVRLASPSDVVDKAAYVLANPALAGLVPSGRQWPGLWSAPESIGGPAIQVARPRHFFAENGALPQSAELKLTPPAGFTAAEFQRQVVARLAEREREAECRFEGRFIGARRVMKQKPTARPRSFEPRRVLNPRVAARDPWKRQETLARLKAFVVAYRAALAQRLAGCADVVFPAGTYQLRVFHRVPCAASG